MANRDPKCQIEIRRLAESSVFPSPGGSGDQFGISVSLAGDRALVGDVGDEVAGSSVGQAHLFDTVTGSLLQTLDHPSPTTIDSFGNAVGLEGGRLVVGVRFDDAAGSNVGRVYSFEPPVAVPIPFTVHMILGCVLALACARPLRQTAMERRSENGAAIPHDAPGGLECPPSASKPMLR